MTTTIFWKGLKVAVALELGDGPDQIMVLDISRNGRAVEGLEAEAAACRMEDDYDFRQAAFEKACADYERAGHEITY